MPRAKKKEEKTKEEEVSTGSASWFLKGKEGFQKTEMLETQRKALRERSVFRFTLKANEEAVVVFLDNEPFFIYEHQIWKVKEKRMIHISCSRDYHACPVCASGDTPKWTAFLTVIDTRTFKKADGTVKKNTRCLFGARGPAIGRLADLLKSQGTLAGKAFKVKRYGDKDSAVGSSFEFIRKINITKLKDAKPFDYNQVLSIMPESALKALGFGFEYASQAAAEGGRDEPTTVEGLEDLI